MTKYKAEIAGINTNDLKSLTHEENVYYFKKMHEGDKNAKETLINGNLRLVLSVLKYFSYKNVNLDDLFQVGVVGLIKAIDNFDETLNLKLSTYAVPLIIGEIKKYLRDNIAMRIPRSIKDNSYRIIAFKEKYFNEYGIEPSIGIISKELDLNEYDIAFALNSLKEPMSISEPVYEDGGDVIYLEDQIADKKQMNINNDELIALNKALKMVDKRDREILIKRFIVGKTQTELASEYQISQAQVSRLEKGAINKVRRLVR